MNAVEVVAALPDDVAKVTDYGHGGPRYPERLIGVKGFSTLCGSRLVVHEGTEVRFCRDCGEQVRVWRFAVDPPDAFGETEAGRRFWNARPWLVGHCERCWLERDPGAALQHRADLSKIRREMRRLIERRRGEDREPVIYTPETED